MRSLRALASGRSSSTICEASSRVGTSTRAPGCAEEPAVRSIIGIPNASVLPEPVGDAARTSTPARASGKTSAWMANGDRMPSRASASVTGALTPSAVNDWIIWWFLPCEAGSRCERLETPAFRRNEKLDLRTPKGVRSPTVALRPGLSLGLLGLSLLFQRLLSRLLFAALSGVLVLGRHLL